MEYEGYCEPTPGPEGAACFFRTAEQCAELEPGARVCVGREVHACDGDRSRLVEKCAGDAPLCSEGACGCVNDVCPELLATTRGVASRLALSGSYLYWIDDVANVLGRVPVAGGEPTILASRSAKPTGLVLDTRNVFWTESEPGRVMKSALDGSGATTIVPGVTAPRALAMDADSLYWISDTPGDVMKVAKSGGMPVTIAPAGDALSLLVTRGHAYFGGSSAVSRVSVGGGVLETLTPMPRSAEYADSLAADDTYLYLHASSSTLASPSAFIIGRVPLLGGALSLVDDAPLGKAMATDGRHVYVVHIGKVMRRDVDGSNPLIVFDSQSNPRVLDIQVDSGWIYLGVENSIYRLRKL